MNDQWSELDNLIIYRGILQDKLIMTLRSNTSEAERIAAMIQTAEELSLEGDVVTEYLIHLIAEDENPFSIMAEKSGGAIGASLMQAVLHDIEIIKRFFCMDAGTPSTCCMLHNYQPTRRKSQPYIAPLRNVLRDLSTLYTTENAASILTDHYVRHGYGDMARYSVFSLG